MQCRGTYRLTIEVLHVLVARVLAAARRQEAKHLNLRKPARTALSEGRSSVSPSALARGIPSGGVHLPLIQGGLPSPWSRLHPVAATPDLRVPSVQEHI